MKRYNCKPLAVVAAAVLLVGAMMMGGCKSQKPVQPVENELAGPTFSADSAYAFCEEQCAFGPRVMNSEAHDRCEQWIVEKFKQYGAEVTTQKATLTGWDGTKLKATNIIASINPNADRRLLICAHWDCRPWADNDPDSANWHKPVMAANDAASGVAVMLELCRIIDTKEWGIDFVCFDAEDYGAPQWSDMDDTEDTWALGAQHFAQQYADGSFAAPGGTGWIGGILLDMVGGEGAKFYQEGLSVYYASGMVNGVWQSAATAGYSRYFPKEKGGTITDDHKPLNEVGIPTIDIIPYYPDCEMSSFGPTWHTVDDNMQHIDKNTLKAVGQSIVQYLYE